MIAVSILIKNFIELYWPLDKFTEITGLDGFPSLSNELSDINKINYQWIFQKLDLNKDSEIVKLVSKILEENEN